MALPFAAAAQQTAYPTRPIRLIVPYPPGGPLDTAARALAERVKDSLGTIVVENRAGAGGNIGVDQLAKSAPDGYTIGIGAVATHAINPWLFARLPYDPIKDFAPITLIAHVPNVLVMPPETAARYGIDSVRDLIDRARKNPGRLNYASGGNGSAGHMAGELLKSMARISIVHIPYAGAAPAQLGLLAGQTELMFDNLASAAPQIRAGKLRAFAVTTAARAASFPDLPTMAEAGGKELAGFDVSTWFGVFAPAGTPPAIVERLGDEFRRALATSEMRERLARMGAEPAPTTPSEFAAFVRNELAKYEKVVKFSGARVD
ncbi:MAG: Bug family tripartite tricarboxylate transporter substrate binding protein [Burkholderiaceae bacterium]